MFHILILHLFKNTSGVIFEKTSKKLIENKITSVVFLSTCMEKASTLLLPPVQASNAVNTHHHAEATAMRRNI